MHDSERILRPLRHVDPERLDSYRGREELTRAVTEVGGAVLDSVRLLLRSDPAAREELRISAFSPEEAPLESVVESLRSRDRISIELAAAVHQTAGAVERARESATAADADVVRRAAELFEREVRSLADREVREAAHHAVEEHALYHPPHAVPPPHGARRRAHAVIGVIVLLAAVAAVILILVLSRGPSVREGIEAFRAGELATAEESFRAVLGRDPANVTALLYLARIQRREGRMEEAATLLQRAVEAAPRDADVRRELAHLFMELDRPAQAAAQYQRAVELDPADTLAWVGLIQALRAAGDPRAADVYRRAPAEARDIVNGA